MGSEREKPKCDLAMQVVQLLIYSRTIPTTIAPPAPCYRLFGRRNGV